MGERNLDFDTVVERKDTCCLKYDVASRRGMPEGLLPLWVADMDFKTSSYIEDAAIERIKHGIFGYSISGDEYFKALEGWMYKRHNWKVKKSWIVKTPGVVFALASAVKAFTNVGDNVLIQKPVYYPFSSVIEDNGRNIVSNDLYLGDDNRYHIDYEDFEQKIIDNNIKLFLMCNPHNPTGRVFTKEELIRMGDICIKHGVIVVVDEIHNDFILKGKHTVFASLGDKYRDISITCTSPSKTFNLAGLMISNIFVPNRKLFVKFRHQVDADGISQLNVIGLIACKTAYSKCDEWYSKMLDYVKKNVAFVKEYVKKNIPNVDVIDSEGTYLVWLDFRKTGIPAKTLDKKIVNEAKLWLDSGTMFGKTGEGFQRINVATPRKIVVECLERIKDLVEKNSTTTFIRSDDRFKCSLKNDDKVVCVN